MQKTSVTLMIQWAQCSLRFQIISFMYWGPIICGLSCDSKVDRSKTNSSKAGLGLEKVVDKLSCGHPELETSWRFSPLLLSLSHVLLAALQKKCAAAWFFVCITMYILCVYECAQCVCWKMKRGWPLSSGAPGFRDTQAKSVNERTHTSTNRCEVVD